MRRASEQETLNGLLPPSGNDGTRQGLRVALVALPWSRADRPSPAIAALSAYVRQKRPEVRVKGYFEFLPVADAIGRELYHVIAEACYLMGELLLTPFIYPERANSVREEFEAWVAAKVEAGELSNDDVASKDLYALVQETLRDHLNDLTTELASFDVVGLTTCFGQLFGNVALANQLKRAAPDVKVVLGGSTISSRVGPSILDEYPSIDFIIQGEGEQPFVALLDSLASQSAGSRDIAGLLSRGKASASDRGAELSEVPSLDDLPIPDYEDFAQVAEQYGFDWTLAIEGSRGCWWDRARRTGNPKDTCYFCNQNVQWLGYREKSTERVIAEIVELSDRYRNLKLFFADNIVRHKRLAEFAQALNDLDRHFEIFHEMRANVRPYEFLLMWEAGLERVLFGIEGLSTSYLRRIGKGTSTIQNLQAMRMCAELQVGHDANLIVDFPGATDEEVRESRQTILDYALSFEPLEICPFFLGVDSTVDRLRHQFGITHVRNYDAYLTGLPEDVWNRLKLWGLSFDLMVPGADWTPLRKAVAEWVDLHERKSKGPLLLYRDGGSYLIVEDERFGDYRQGRFSRVERDIYLYCTEARSFAQIAERHKDHGLEEVELRDLLNQFVESKIMYTEDDKYLSLAVASQPRLAATRIRSLEKEEESKRGAARCLRLSADPLIIELAQPPSDHLRGVSPGEQSTLRAC